MLPSRDCSSQSASDSSDAKYFKLDLSNTEKSLHRYRKSKFPKENFVEPCIVKVEERTSPNKSSEFLQNNYEKYKSSVTEPNKSTKLYSNSSFNYYPNNEHLDDNNSLIDSANEKKFRYDQENSSLEFPLNQQMKFKSEFDKEQTSRFGKNRINPNHGFSNYDYSKGSSSQDLFATQTPFKHSLDLSPGIYKAVFILF